MDDLRKDGFGAGPALRSLHEPLPALPSTGGGEKVPRAQPSQRRKTRVLLIGFVIVLLGGAGFYGWHWWTVGRFLETTDNAYLQADAVTVSPRIAGYVAEALVGDNQQVKAGDVIARLDDRDYKVALKQAQAEVEKDKADLEQVGAALIQQQAQIEQARADVDNSGAALTFSSQEFTRYQTMTQTGSATLQRRQQADADLRQHRAADDKAKAALDSAQMQVSNLKAQEASAKATLEGAEAKLDQANLNLTYTTITAPIDGVVGDRSLRPGQFVAAGTSLLTLVPMSRDIYLVANFKETQVGAMKVGQQVNFTVDAFSDHEFKGKVASLAPGTGSQFALLPPENATGNFTKVVQRVPVRIALDASDPELARLRPGLSAEATVSLRGEPAQTTDTQTTGVLSR